MSLLGKRYAKALLDVAIESNKIDEYKENLKCIIKYFDDVLELEPFIKNSKIGKQEKKDTMCKILESDCDKNFLNFVNLIYILSKLLLIL